MQFWQCDARLWYREGSAQPGGGLWPQLPVYRFNASIGVRVSARRCSLEEVWRMCSKDLSLSSVAYPTLDQVEPVEACAGRRGNRRGPSQGTSPCVIVADACIASHHIAPTV